MSINTLHPQQLEITPDFSVTDDVSVNVEALRLSGLVDDTNREVATQAVTEDFTALGKLGIAGELFVAIPQRQLPLTKRLGVLDGVTKAKYGEDHPKRYVYDKLWTPGTDDETGSYTDEQLGNLGPEYDGRKWVAHGRIIVPSYENPNEPILHHLGKPFDGKYARKGAVTQLEAIASQKAEFEATHPEANMNPLTARDIAFVSLLRQIKGEKMPMEWGFMRDASLPRTEVGGDSLVGSVSSAGSQLRLGGSDGRAGSSVGVGLSVGRKEA